MGTVLAGRSLVQVKIRDEIILMHHSLFAIMFARLRMPVKEVISEFSTIMDRVYLPHTLSPSQRRAQLKQCLEDLFTRTDRQHDMELEAGDDPRMGRCVRCGHL